MLTTIARRTKPENDYPTSDGKPMAETDYHRILMFELIDVLQHHYASDPDVYVSGNLLLFYEQGNKRRHVSPDCFVVLGVPNRLRPNYLLWEEGKGPDVVFELTSKTTRAEDTRKKFNLYQDVLKVPEYFLFDPTEDYLVPSMQGFQLRAGKYVRIKPVGNRIPSRRLGLHIEREKSRLRFWNPATKLWLPTTAERLDAERELVEVERQNVEVEREKARSERQNAEVERQNAEVERQNARSERILRLQLEVELAKLKKAMTKKLSNGHKNGSNGSHS